MIDGTSTRNSSTSALTTQEPETRLFEKSQMMEALAEKRQYVAAAAIQAEVELLKNQTVAATIEATISN